MTIEQKIAWYKKQFPTIKDWKIEYHRDSEETKSCIMYNKKKEAIIRRYRKGPGRIPNDYILHEILHIVMYDMILTKGDKKYDKEESIIRGICGLK